MHCRVNGTKSTVGVVLVNWNGAEDTIPCIESLLAGTVKPDRIVVVDNASRDGSPDLIVQKFPDVTLIRNDENLGFTGANNIGISALMNAACDYIWILNNDTTVDGLCMETLRNYMDSNQEAAASTGKILYADPPGLIWYAGAVYDKWRVQFRHKGAGRMDDGRFDSVEVVPFLSGCCMFVRRTAFERIGPFDDRFFAYAEDADWCLRAKQEHLRLHYVPYAIIRHKVSATVNKLKKGRTGGTTSPFSVYITNRNRIFLIRKHAANVVQAVIASVSLAAWFCWYAAALMILFRLNKFKALVAALYDGVKEPVRIPCDRAPAPRYIR